MTRDIISRRRGIMYFPSIILSRDKIIILHFLPFHAGHVFPNGIVFFNYSSVFLSLTLTFFCMLFPDRAVHSAVDIISVDRAGQWRRTDSSVVQQSA